MAAAHRRELRLAARLREGPLTAAGPTLHGLSSRERWRLVLRNVAIATAMVAAVTLTIWGVHRLLYPPADTRPVGRDADGANRLLPFSPVLSTLVLTGAFTPRFVAGRQQHTP